MRLYSFVAAAALTLASLSAHADMITNTFSFAPLAGYSGETGASFAQFNPALGTLNSVTLNFSGTVTFAGGRDSDDNLAEVELGLGDDNEVASAFSSGNSSSDFVTRSYTYTGRNAVFTGTSFIDTQVTVINKFGTSATPATTFNTETLTYNYTAAAPPPGAVTPEPSSLALLGTGVLGMAGVLRRRFA